MTNIASSPFSFFLFFVFFSSSTGMLQNTYPRMHRAHIRNPNTCMKARTRIALKPSRARTHPHTHTLTHNDLMHTLQARMFTSQSHDPSQNLLQHSPTRSCIRMAMLPQVFEPLGEVAKGKLTEASSGQGTPKNRCSQRSATRSFFA